MEKLSQKCYHSKSNRRHQGGSPNKVHAILSESDSQTQIWSPIHLGAYLYTETEAESQYKSETDHRHIYPANQEAYIWQSVIRYVFTL